MGNITSLDERRRRKIGHQQTKSARETKIVYKNTIDYSLLVPVVLLIALGLIMVFSSSYYASEFRDASNGSPQYFFLKQLAFVIAGFFLMMALSFFDYHRYYSLKKDSFNKNMPLYKKTYLWILIAGLLLSVMVFVPGIGSSARESSRWIRIAGITLMPAEPMKAAMIIFFGCSIGSNPRKISKINKNILPYVGVYAIICVITYLQRNFSAIICYTLLFIIMVYIGGLDSKQLLIVLGTLAGLLVIFVFLEGYRAQRISSWYNMLKESLGLPYEEVDKDAKWQVQQSLYAIGTGGLFGKGIGNSVQKYLWLSLGETDFIFAIIAEELGLFGCFCVILLYGYIIWRGMKIAKNAPDLTGKLIATGITAIFSIQVVLNMCVTTGLIPNTGVVLPFVSYGGSSVVIFMCMIGVLLNISKQCTVTPPLKLLKRADGESVRSKRSVHSPKEAPKPLQKERKRKEWNI
ncbi:MAG: FtsW/RodA/SpoVE family cell cycle protein [Lachnospiraceae bacterium]